MRMYHVMSQPSAGPAFAKPLAPGAAAKQELIAAMAVCSLWAAMVSVLVAMVAYCGANIPLLDEYHQLPLLLGQPLHLHYLWMPWSEHRVPMTRLMLIGLARLTHADVRAPMFAS